MHENNLDLAIIGAGPYGLSLAAHAKMSGLKHVVFGEPMAFWRKQMPPDMFIRTELKYTGLSDPGGRYTLDAYQQEKAIVLSYPMKRSALVDYAFWFVEKTGVRAEGQMAAAIYREQEMFHIVASDGTRFNVPIVVVAVGLTNMGYVPEPLRTLPRSLLSHSSVHTDFASFNGRKVIVLGGGQSAWETAGLLHEAGADVVLVYRRDGRIAPAPGMNMRQQQLAETFFHMSPAQQALIRAEIEIPSVTDFLVPMVEGKVRQRPATVITDAFANGDGKLEVIYDNGGRETADHLIAATGYRYRLENVPFLCPLMPLIEQEADGSPEVNASFCSSLPGLYFAGPATAKSHGPTFRFIAGVWHTSRMIMADLVRI